MLRLARVLPTALPVAWPRTCRVCGRWCRQTWCEGCQARFAPRVARCPGCALPWPAPALSDLRCGACLRQPPAWERAITAVDYGFPWDRLIAALKYGDQPELARPLSGLLAAAVHEQGGPGAPDWVLPVPLAPSRLARRGYNQAWELARRVAGQLGLRSCAEGLQRLDGEQHQVGAGREQRLRQLHDAFWVQPAPPGRGLALAGTRVALVDDVVTTGATAEAAVLALRRAGVASVQLWMLARTPPPD